MKLVAMWIVVAAACGPPPKLARRDVGTPRARQADIFETPSGGHHEAILAPYERVLDEATLVSIPPTQACIELTMRAMDDNAIDAYQPMLVIDGVSVRPTITGERAEHQVCHDEVCTTVRRARLCAPAPATSRGNKIELRMVDPFLVYRSDVTNRVERYQLSFTWRLAD